MPIITVEQTPGKSETEKAEIISAMTDRYAEVTGSKKESVWVLLRETERQDWGIGGETLAQKAAR